MPVEEETTTVGAGTTQVSHTPDQPDSVCVFATLDTDLQISTI